MNTTNTGSAYQTQISTNLNVEQWMRVFAFEDVVQNGDSFGNGEGKNMFAYKPLGSLWSLLYWDLDHGDVLHCAPTPPTFAIYDPALTKLEAEAPFRRAYWRAIYDAVNGPMLINVVGPVLDANYSALAANSIGVLSHDSSPTSGCNLTNSLRGWIAQKRHVLTNELAKLAAPFEISNNGGNNFTTNQSNIVFFGKAPVEVALIRLNGASTNLPVTWTSVTNWSVTITLTNGANSLTNRGYDRLGVFLTNAIDSITITNQP